MSKEALAAARVVVEGMNLAHRVGQMLFSVAGIQEREGIEELLKRGAIGGLFIMRDEAAQSTVNRVETVQEQTQWFRDTAKRGEFVLLNISLSNRFVSKTTNITVFAV